MIRRTGYQGEDYQGNRESGGKGRSPGTWEPSVVQGAKNDKKSPRHRGEGIYDSLGDKSLWDKFRLTMTVNTTFFEVKI